MEDETQQIITFLHSRKLTLLYTLKLLYMWLFTLPISTFSIIYPIIFHKFDYTPSFQQALIAFSCHQLSALLGISIAAWFNQKLIRTTLLSFFGLCTILSISLGGQGIIDQTTPIISWIIPPYRIILFILSDDHNANSVLKPIEIAYPVIYITVLILSFLLVMEYRKFENSAK
jgi:hypothetical protein